MPSLADLRRPPAEGPPGAGLADAFALGLGAAALVEALVTSTLDCVKILSPEGRIVFVNAPGLSRMGVASVEAVRGRPWAEFWAGGDRARIATALATALGGLPNRLDAVCDTRDGDARDWHVTLTPLKAKGGEVLAVLVVSRDTTGTARV